MQAHTTNPTSALYLFAAVLLAYFALGSSQARADSRKGFVAGGGVGPGLVSLGLEDDTRDTHFGLTTDITLGYGISDQIVTYAMSRIVWFDLDGELTFSETAGAGVSYFLEDTAPSLYVAGGIGAAVFVQPAADTDNQFGLAGLVGVGYEARKHWLAELDIAYGNPGDFNSTTVMAKLNYYYY